MKAGEIVPGVKIHRFTIVSFSHKDSRHRKWWNVVCECGLEKAVHGSSMVSGNTKSCGCYGKDRGVERRKSKNHTEVTAIILGYKRHALDKGNSWNISRQDVESIIKKNCHYCGIEPSNLKKTKNSIDGGLRYSGIDRVDSSSGYSINNVVPACKACNYSKGIMSKKEFKEWIMRIASMANQWG